METSLPRQRDEKSTNDSKKNNKDYCSEDLARSLLFEADYDYKRRHENSLLAEYILSQD